MRPQLGDQMAPSVANESCGCTGGGYLLFMLVSGALIALYLAVSILT